MPHYIDLDKMQIIMAARGCGKSALLNALRELPAEDVAPVIHAHWIKNKGYMLSCCSACQNTIPLGREYKHKYCPNCGAKMDGGD